jgi:hypothetical protein
LKKYKNIRIISWWRQNDWGIFKRNQSSK